MSASPLAQQDLDGQEEQNHCAVSLGLGGPMKQPWQSPAQRPTVAEQAA